MGENPERPTLKIGQLARRLGLNVRTVRYYEEIGLLPPAARTEGGYRLYSDEDERRLRFVLQAKRVGFSLEEIQRIVQFGGHGSACDYVRETLSRHIEEIDARIAELQQFRAQLVATASAWQEQGAAGDGPFCGLIEGWSPSPLVTEKETDVATQTQAVCGRRASAPRKMGEKERR